MITAIICAHNESPRISPVLSALTSCSLISETIVVNDGSNDNLEKVVKAFPRIKYLKNEVNQGKGYCMELASKNTSADILLFCDADLTGLTPEIFKKVIDPVASGLCDMFIGIYYTPFHAFFDRFLSSLTRKHLLLCSLPTEL